MIALDMPHKAGKGPDEIFICCPLCPTRAGKVDEKFKMGVNIHTGRFNCFRCGACNYNTKLKFLENLEFYAREDLEMDELLEVIDNIGVKKKLQDIDLNQFTVPVNPEETPIAYKYITETRKLSDNDILKYNIRVGKPYWTTGKDGVEFESKKWCGRVVFPFMEQGKAKFLVGRTYTNSPTRYLNSDDRKKDAYVYGIDNITDGVAILCEGIISSIAAEKATGVPAVSVLGCFATDLQLLKLSQKVHTIFMSLDGGVDRIIERRLEKQLLDLGIKLYKITLPGDSDPDDLGPLYKNYFETAQQISLF